MHIYTKIHAQTHVSSSYTPYYTIHICIYTHTHLTHHIYIHTHTTYTCSCFGVWLHTHTLLCVPTHTNATYTCIHSPTTHTHTHIMYICNISHIPHPTHVHAHNKYVHIHTLYKHHTHIHIGTYPNIGVPHTIDTNTYICTYMYMYIHIHYTPMHICVHTYAHVCTQHIHVLIYPTHRHMHTDT